MKMRGVLHRVQTGEYGKETTGSDVESIVEHLRFLLNTRIGEAPTVPDYGIEDLSDLTRMFPEAAETWERSIKATIEKYEPRLTAIRVRHIIRPEDPLIVHFEITARLAEDRRRPLKFATQTDSSGHFDIS